MPSPSTATTTLPSRLSSAASDDDMSSLLIAALPASIQSRIPKIRSLRRTVSMQNVFFRSESTSTISSTSASDISLPSSPCSSPPSSRPSTSAGSGTRRDSGKDASDFGLVLAPKNRQTPSDVTASRVNWKYAQNGFRSLQNATREAGDPDRLPELERQLYVESVAYLLRGLPGDLQDNELSQLRQAAPETLLNQASLPFSVSSLSTEQKLMLQQQHLRFGTATPQMAYYKKRTWPHKATHWLVTRIYALIMMLLPIMASLARWAIDMERKYHVPEAVLSWATALCIVSYRNAAELYVAVCNAGDGSVGRAFDDGTAYLANGVASGFREAVLDVARGQI